MINQKNRPDTYFPIHQVGKLPPQATDLEEAVLGAIMLDKDAILEVADFLKPEIFYTEAHQKIFKAMLDLMNDSFPIDILTVPKQLRQNGELEMVGGNFYIVDLTKNVSSAANIVFHARVVYQKFLQREVIRMGQSVANSGYDDTTDVFDLIESHQVELLKLMDQNYSRDIKPVSSLLKERIAYMKIPAVDGIVGIPSGYAALDAVTGGWQKSDLTIIAARPAMGKTATVVNFARNAAVDFGKPVAIFSLEMSSAQLTDRLISSETNFRLEFIRKKSLGQDDLNQLEVKTSSLDKAPLFIDDTPGLSLTQFRSKAIKLKKKHDVQMIIIDYLQLMTAKQEGRGFNREQEIGAISRGLKLVAKELDIPVIALAQLSRAVESRPGGGKKPMLSDLRESGSIEQDADNVFFLYRPEYYGISADEDNQSTAMQLQVIVAKNRNGVCETVKLGANLAYMRIFDWEKSLNSHPSANVYYAADKYDPNTEGEELLF